MMKKLTQAKNINWIIVLLVTFFVSEAIYKYLIDLHLKEYRIAGVIKFIAQIGMGFIILKEYKKNTKNIGLLVILAILFLLGQIAIQEDNIFVNIEYFNNSVFLAIVLLFANTLTLSEEQKKQIFKWFEIVIIVNSIAVIVGFVFSITFFETYQADRFGYSGFLIKSSYASYFYLIGVFYYTHQAFILNKSKKLLFLLVAFSAIIVGTKAAVLSLLLCVLFIVFKRKLLLNKVFVLIIFAALILAVIFNKKILFFFTPYIDVFLPIIEQYGILTALFSYRDLILEEHLIPFIQSDWTLINYLFGGIGSILIKSGLDFIDVFYFFGIIGGALYVYILYRVLYIYNVSKDYICFILFICIVMSLAGNFFYNSSVAILMCIMKLYFQSTKEHES